MSLPLEPEDWITKAQLIARPVVIAAGLSDDDIDHLIKETRHEVNADMRRESGLIPTNPLLP